MSLFTCIVLGMYISTIPLMLVAAYLDMDAGPIKHERKTEFVVWIASTVFFTVLNYVISNGMI